VNVETEDVRMYRVTALALLTINLTACDSLSQVFTHTTNSATAPISEVQVELDSGSVQVTAGGEGQVKSAAVAQWVGEKPTVEFVQEGTLLRVIAICGRAETCQIDLAFEMPPAATLRVVGEATYISLASLRGPATLQTGTGDVDLKEVAGALEVSTREGSIRGENLRSQKAIAQTMNGEISLDFAGPVSSAWAETVRGDITMTVPRTSYVVEAKSDDGRVDVAVQQSPSSRRLLHAVAVEAGDISIRQRDITLIPPG
jgi:hypothetical protein